MNRILIVEDDPIIRALYTKVLGDEFSLEILESGNGLLKKINEFSPELIILDIDLGTAQNGYDLARSLRAEPTTKEIPFLFVTGKSEPENLVKGFQLGAEDYLEKPFRPYDLLARIKTRITKIKQREESSDEILVGPLKMNTLNQTCTIKSEDVPLPPSEFQILAVLAKNKGNSFSRGELCLKALGKTAKDERLVDTYVSSLRKKHPLLKKSIRSKYGVGYFFDQKSLAN